MNNQLKMTGVAALVVLMGAGGVFAESLTVSSATCTASSDVWYDSVTVTCDSTISGAINLADGAVFKVTGGKATVNATVTMGTSGTGSVAISPSGGATAEFLGKITGPASINISGSDSSAVIRFTSDTSDYDGALTINSGSFYARGTCPFGSTAGATTLNNGSQSKVSLFFDGVTTYEELHFSSCNGSSPWSDRNVFFTPDSVNTFNGICTQKVSNIMEWWCYGANAKVIFNNTATFGQLMGGDNGTYYSGQASAPSGLEMTFNASPTLLKFYNAYQTVTLNAPVNFVKNSSDNFRIRASSTYNLNCEDALGDESYSTALRYENSSVWGVKFNMPSNDQHIAYFANNNSSASGTTVINSSEGATLHVMCSAGASYAQDFKGTFTGKVALSLEGESPLTLSGASTSTGILSLSNGASLTLDSGANWAGPVSIASASETLTLNCEAITVPELWINGVRQKSGIYGGEDSAATKKLAQLAGSGVINVQPAVLEITGDYVVPEEGVSCGGVKVTGAATVSGGTIHVVGLGTSGASATFSASAAATFTCPVDFDVSSGKVVIAPDAVTLNFNGVVSGDAEIEISATSTSGHVYFSGANTFNGNLDIVEGNFHAVGDGAFGSTNGYTKMDAPYQAQGSTPKCSITFENLTTGEDIRFHHGGSWGVNSVLFKGAVTFNGPVTGISPTRGEWWYCYDNTSIAFNGALSGFGDLIGGDLGGSTPTVTFAGDGMELYRLYWLRGVLNFDKPFTLTERSNYENFSVRGNGTYNFIVADVFGDTNYCSRLRFDSSAKSTYPNVSFNLAADQHFMYLSNSGNISTTTTFNSENGAVLHLMANTDASEAAEQTVAGLFTGNIGLSVEGNLPLTLTGANTSTNALTLANGAQVAFSGSGMWNGDVVCNYADDDDMPSLTLGSDTTVTALYTNGVKLAYGKYGATAATGVTVLPWLKGEGTVSVLRTLEVLVVNGNYTVNAAGEIYKGVIVNAAATISGGTLTLAEDATITVNNDASFECPVALIGEKSTIVPASGVTAVFNGVISGGSPIDIAAADVSGVVRFRGANTFDGRLTITTGSFHAENPQAFGSTVGATYFRGHGEWNAAKTQLATISNRIYFDNVGECPEAFELSTAFGDWNTASQFVFFSGTNKFTGSWTSADNIKVVEYGWMFSSNSTTSFAGGMSGYGGLLMHHLSTGVDKELVNAVVNIDAPASCANCWYGQALTFNYNAVVTASEYRLRRGTHNLNVENAFGTGKPLMAEENTLADYPCTVNLNRDQSFSRFGKEANSEYMYINSATSNTIHFTGTTASEFRGMFTGSACVAFDGAASNTLAGVSTSTGLLSVAGGATVSFTEKGKWNGAILIADGGLLRMEGKAVGKTAVIDFVGDAASGQIENATGNVLRIGGIRINGAEIPFGLYSSVAGRVKYRHLFKGETPVWVGAPGFTISIR